MLVLWSTLAVARPMQVTHYQLHPRYEFGIKLLELALSKHKTPFEIVSPYSRQVTEARGEQDIIKGKIDLQFMSTTPEREAAMIPIKIPIYQGMLGLRLLLVTPDMNEKIRKVDSLTALSKFAGGHGSQWGDLPVYAANNLNVVTSVSYDNLFTMLKNGRFHYFHRGLSEIWGELDQHKDLMVADDVMLLYPHPVYFFVGKHNSALANHLKTGLERAIEDGSYQKLFLQYHQEFIRKGELAGRKLIILKNPVVPEDTPAINLGWWMPEFNLKSDYFVNLSNQ